MLLPNRNPIQNLIVETFDYGNQRHVDALPDIVAWGVEHCVAPPVSRTGEARHMLGAVAVDEATQEICGYGGIKRPWSLKVVEFGGLVIADSARRQGAATKITHHVLTQWRLAFPGKNHAIIAFANSSSAEVFERLGGQDLGTKKQYLKDQPHGPVNQSPHLISPDSLDNWAFDLTNIR